MFMLHKPDAAEIALLLERAGASKLSYSQEANAISTKNGAAGLTPPRSFAVDHTRSQIGIGQHSFQAAKIAMRQWLHFDLGWVSIANPAARIDLGQIVAVEAHTLGLWSLNFSRILYVIDEEDRFGYAYGTTEMHVESGEERFLLELDSARGDVFYDLLAVSRPAHWLTRLGYPYTRSQQCRFARDSHARMAERA